MNYGSTTSSWKPQRSVRLDLVLMLRAIYINFNLNPLTKFFFIHFCLTQLTDFVSTGMDKQMHTVDISRSSESIWYFRPQREFLEKMKYFGFQTSVIKWLEFYLSNRKFLVCIDKCFFWGWNIKVWCTTRLYSWITPFSITCKWFSPIITRCRLLLVCRWHLHFLPKWGRSKIWKCFR